MSESTSNIGRIVYATGFILLCHAAYSAVEHINYLKAVEKLDEGLTIDIILEALVGMVICFFGITSVSGTLKAVALESELLKKSIDSLDSRLSFVSYNHRGKFLFSRSNSTSSEDDKKK
ncbi:membrane magnesium transporter-domain-containing protein [Paraphysoderma sedebokerense]|nr:membrane magnesium transporter-domain-containing protein [Paraphysoderma sedebokerense]